MSFFADRLEAFPRIGPYRMAQENGLLAVLQDGRERLDAPVHDRGPRVHQLRLEQLPEPLVPPDGHRGRPGRDRPLRDRRHRLPAAQRDARRCTVSSRPSWPTSTAGRRRWCSRPATSRTCASISGFLERHDYALVDKEAHNSLLTGVRALRRDDEAVPPQRRRPARPDPRRTLPDEAGKGIVIDGVYSMGGDTAPLDSHGRDVPAPPEHVHPRRRGARPRRARRPLGRGAAEQYGVLADVDLVTITFSKTLGSCGGALIGPPEAIELLTLDSDPLIFTASNTPGSVAAALAALRILRAEPERPARPARQRRPRSCALARASAACRRTPSRARSSPSRCAATTTSRRWCVFRELFELGVFVNPVIPPASAREMGLIRLSLMADHTPGAARRGGRGAAQGLHRPGPAPPGPRPDTRLSGRIPPRPAAAAGRVGRPVRRAEPP